MKKISLVVAFCILTATLLQGNVTRKILLLHSYHYGMNWAESVISGIKKQKKIAETKGFDIDITYEFMDTKKYTTEDYFKYLHDIYKFKYKNQKYDVIIAADDAAMNFLIKHRDELFEKTPVVFTGINFYSDDIIKNNWGFTGVVEEADGEATIQIALKNFPNTKKIVVVGDQSITSVMDRKTIQKAMPKFPGIEFQFLEDGNIFAYQKLLQELPDTAVIFAMHVNQDQNGKYYTLEESFDVYTLHVKRPIYTFWDFYFGRGALGGMIVSGEAQGEEAAIKAIQILMGQPVDSIKVLKESPNQYIFDYNIMKNFNLDIKDMPASAIILNKPKGLKELYEENKEFIIIMLLVILGLSGVIFVLSINIIKRKKVEKFLVVTNAAYQRFVPSEFLHYLGKNDITKVQLGDQIQKDMSILFSDIRSFTTISEQMTPEETFNFINEYLGIISPVIRHHNGFIDKYIGDAIMAIFPEKAEDSVRTAIEMQQNLMDYNITRKKANKLPVSIGVGIHSGLLMLGTVGEKKRMEGTVISDTVNLSSRLEGLTKHFGANIIVSEDVINKIGENMIKYNTRFLGKVTVKGKTHPIGIYQVIDGNEAAIVEKLLKSKSIFERAIKSYLKKDFAPAAEDFNKVLTINPEDVSSRLYLDVIAQSYSQAAAPDWTGAIDMHIK